MADNNVFNTIINSYSVNSLTLNCSKNYTVLLHPTNSTLNPVIFGRYIIYKVESTQFLDFSLDKLNWNNNIN